MGDVVPLRQDDQLDGGSDGGASWNRTSDLSCISVRSRAPKPGKPRASDPND